MPTAPHPLRLEDARRLFLADDLPAANAVAEALIGTATPWRAVQIDAALLLARGLRRQSRLDDALASCASAVAAAQALGDRHRECLAHAARSHVLTCTGESDQALVESYAALALADRLGEASAQAAAHEALGDVHWAMQQWEAGALAYGRAVELAQSCSDIETASLAHAGLGAMAHGQGLDASDAGRLAEARACQQRSAWHAAEFTRLAEQVGDVHNASQGRHNEAVALMELGEWARARARFESFLGGLPEGPSDLRATVLKNLAGIDILEGSLGAGIARMQQALAMNDALQLPIYAIYCCRELAHVCERIGDLAGALHYQKRFHALYVQLASESAQSHAREMAVVYETDQVRACRRGDLAARCGGEEFVLVLDGLSASEALLACERLRRAIEQVAWPTVHAGLAELTVSIGLAHRGEPGAPAEPAELLALADRRLYAAKDAGRNRVVASPSV